MNAFRLTVSSPDGDLFDGESTFLALRGTEGELAIMAGHVPFVTAVAPGACTLELPDGSVRGAQMQDGLLTVAADRVTLLSGSFAWKK